MRRLSTVALVLGVTLLGAADQMRAGASAVPPAPEATTALDPALANRLAQAGPNEPVEVVVVLRRQAALPSLPRSRRVARRAAVVRALHATADAAQRPLLALLAHWRAQGRVTDIRPLWIFDGLVVRAMPEVVRELAARPDVRQVTAARAIFAPAATAASTAAAATNLSLVDAPALWSLGYRGQNVVVASMDTGVDVTHPDLAASWRGGTNSWYDPNGEHPTTPTDRNGHGTWTMGVMVGGETGGTAIGVAPAAKWIAVKMFNDRGTSTTAIVHQGFQWLLDPDGNPDTPDAPDVVNNSWSMTTAGCDLEFQLDLRSLRAAGILPVFAAGNSGPSSGTSLSPANNPEAFAVGASDMSDAVASSSSRGPSACDGGVYPKLVAPGVGIRTTDLYDSYTTQTGTSVAAPHVAGALALLLSAFPDLPADRQEAALEQGARDLLDPGPDNAAGYGRLDVLASYDWLATAPDFTLSASPASATTTAGGSVSYTVDVGSLNGFAGDVSLSLSGLTPAQGSWTLAPATIPGGAGSARLDVSTSTTLQPGAYQLTISATSGSLSHRATVALEVPAPPDFTLSASPASATTTAGGSVSYTVDVGSLNGFADAVALTLSGLTASQATWAFSPASVAAAGTSTLTLATSASLPPGTYPLTITGTSGGTAHAVAVALAVSQPPAFALTASPAQRTVTAGSNTSYTVRVTPSGGFNGTVALSVTGLPASATAGFAPNPVSASGTATLTVRTTRRTPRGTFALTVTGKAGALSRQATATLVVR